MTCPTTLLLYYNGLGAYFSDSLLILQIEPLFIRMSMVSIFTHIASQAKKKGGKKVLGGAQLCQISLEGVGSDSQHIRRKISPRF